jgi:hypothetical protein
VSALPPRRNLKNHDANVIKTAREMHGAKSYICSVAPSAKHGNNNNFTHVGER